MNLTPKRIELIKKDVSIIREKAVGVIIISPNNKNFEFIENKRPRLSVLAIIGPSEKFGEKFDQVLLCEVGIGRTRPYSESQGIRRKKHESNIAYRRKWFALSEKQYLLVARFVFNFLQELTEKKISKWKSGGSFFVKTPNRFWTKKRKILEYSESHKEWPRGSRFSFNKEDVFFIEDIFWSEIKNSEQNSQITDGLTRFTDKRLSPYKKRTDYKDKKPFAKLKGVQDIRETMDKLPLYLKAEVLKKLPNGEKNFFYHELKKLFGIKKETKEHTLARQAENLHHPENRIGDMTFRITTGLDTIKNYIVVEFFSNKENEYNDDMPF
ncbi:MAG: hypothetical protein K9M15_02880 [Candidatus Marinimicrobia bacterium]|nr:hypothetical protein [Candidatus Neomarinimicrobiota bacterium]